MIQLQTQLSTLQSALVQVLGKTRTATTAVANVDAFIRGIERKTKFVQHHSAILGGVHWNRLESIGRGRPDGAGTNHMTFALQDASLVIKHSDAIIDHVYVAFDGIIAAIVNITDTMGRLLNFCYQLGIHERRASLLSLKNNCTATSPIGAIVNDRQYTEWLVKVRDLRGRCQHADIEDALFVPAGAYARRGQPMIHEDYYWQTPSKHVPLIDYSQEAALEAEKTLLAIIMAVLQAPQNPCS